MNLDPVDLFGSLPAGSYKGVVFAVLDIALSTGARVVFHEFPHRPGHRAEYTGRKAVSGSMTCAAFASLTQFRGGANSVLWPGSVVTLREKVQESKSGPLVVPTFGTLPRAVCHMEERYNGKQRNGCFFVLSFTEDMGDTIAIGNLAAVRGRVAQLATGADNELAAARLRVRMQVEDENGRLATATDFGTAIKSLTFALDSTQESLARPLRQIDAIVGAVDDLFASVDSLSDPRQWKLSEALRDLRSSMIATIDEVKKTSRDVVSYMPAAAMSAAAVAAATSNAVEDILRLNPGIDGNDIPGGELLAVYSANSPWDSLSPWQR